MNNIINEMISSMQKNENKKKYPTKTPKDIIKCVICGTYYTRPGKTQHERTKMHKRAVKSFRKITINNLNLDD